MAGETIGWGDAPRLCICIATYKRPIGLARLLRGIDRLQFHRMRQPRIDVIVVDNDAEGSAGPVCAELGARARWPIGYVAEPRRGIPFARNAAVQAARSFGGELIAFIDDDEVPEPAWLDELLAVMTECRADVVTGPVLPAFEGDVAGWILKGKFFERPRHPTGTCLEQARTGNVLLRMRVFDRVGRAFDEALGLTGGEDTEFFLRVARAGCAIVWADTAAVHEWNPETRTRAAWLLRRAFDIGNSWGRLDPILRPWRRGALRGLAKGILTLPVSVAQGRHAIVHSLQLVAVGVGYLAARAGLRSDVYRQTHGH